MGLGPNDASPFDLRGSLIVHQGSQHDRNQTYFTFDPDLFGNAYSSAKSEHAKLVTQLNVVNRVS